MFTGNAAYKARCQFVRVTSVLCHVPHSAAFPPLFAAKNHRFSTFFCRNLFGEDEYDNSEFFKKTKCPATWTPPPPNSYKINVEGAVFAAHKSAGVGILIRDEGSRLVGACSKKILAPLGAVQAEAKAIELGLQFAKDMLIQEFVLESDSLILVNALKEVAPPPTAVAALVYCSLAASHEFCQVDISHVGRQGNRFAHLLVKHALGIVKLFSIM